MTTIIHLRSGGRIEIGLKWTRVVLPDGAEVYGEPQENEAQLATASDLGYGHDTWAMVRNHDPLHALLADLLGMEWSFSMMYATGMLPPEEIDMAKIEETAVIGLQRYLAHLDLSVIDVAQRNGYRIVEE